MGVPPGRDGFAKPSAAAGDFVDAEIVKPADQWVAVRLDHASGAKPAVSFSISETDAESITRARLGATQAKWG